MSSIRHWCSRNHLFQATRLAAIVCVAIKLFSMSQRSYAQDYPPNLSGAKVVTKWTADKSQCKITVQYQNLTREKLIKVPVTGGRLTYVAFPPLLNSAVTTDIGHPELPYVTVRLDVPQEAKLSLVVDRVELRGGDAGPWNNIQVIPSAGPWPETKGAPMPAFAPDPTVYNDDSFYPREFTKLGSRYAFRGANGVNLKFFPIAYNPVLRQVRSYLIEATLYVAPAGRPVAEAWQKDNRNRIRFYSSIFGHEYLSQFHDYIPPDASHLPDRMNGDGCDYLIIAEDALVTAIDPLVKLKRGRGLTTRMFSLGEIGVGAGDTDDDRRNKIRGKIESEYNKHPAPSYLLLVGDYKSIPPYYKTPHPFYDNVTIATDLYYTTLEPVGTKSSLACGRLPARNGKELSDMVRRIVAYEKSIDDNAKNSQWGSFLLAAFYENQGSFEDGKVVSRTNRYFHQTAYNIARFVRINKRTTIASTLDFYVAQDDTLDKPWYNFDNTPIPPDITKAFRTNTQSVTGIREKWAEDTRIVLHRDHGRKLGWETPSFNVAELPNLKSPTIPPVVFSINCESGWYDDDASFALAMMRSEKGPSAFLGSSRVSWSKYNDRFAEGLIKAMWTDFEFDFNLPDVIEAKRLGSVVNYARQHLLAKYSDPTADMTNELFNLLGDPEMRVLRTSSTPPTDSTKLITTRKFTPSFVTSYR